MSDLTTTLPRYVVLGNGVVAERFLEAMLSRHYLPEEVFLNAPAKQRNTAGIRAVCGSAIAVRDWSDAARTALLKRARKTHDLWLLSIYFGHILDGDVLAAVDGRGVNMHPGLLPWCRGSHTNVWPIVERSPAGVTLHAMVAEVDAGPVLVQREVPVRPWDTAASLYTRLEDAAVGLLEEAWPRAVLDRWPGSPQGPGGSYHAVRDLARLDKVDLDESLEARTFFDTLRARSFAPHPGVVLTVDGKRVEATIVLKEAPR